MGAASSGRQPRIAVVGATGVVGRQILELLEQRAFACSELRLFAGEEGFAQSEEEGELAVARLNEPAELSGFDIAFLAVPGSCAAEIIRANPGPFLIDLSAAGREATAAPLVAPGLTPRETLEKPSGKIFAIPHPAAHAVATILKALEAGDRQIAATVLLSASAEGSEEVSKLVKQSADLMNARLSLEEDETQLGFNVFAPEREGEIASAITSQTAQLLGRAPNLSVQAIQVPVPHGMALMLHVSAPIDAAEVREKLRSTPGLLVAEEQDELRGTADALGQEAIAAAILDRPPGIALRCLFDNARFAALAAVWAAETLAAVGGGN